MDAIHLPLVVRSAHYNIVNPHTSRLAIRFLLEPITVKLHNFTLLIGENPTENATVCRYTETVR